MTPAAMKRSYGKVLKGLREPGRYYWADKAFTARSRAISLPKPGKWILGGPPKISRY